MARLTMLTLALIGVASAAYAQSSRPLDPYGHPYVSSDPQPSPGDYTRERPGPQAPSSPSQSMATEHGNVQHETSSRDEYGFRYDARGDRIDARGRTISPQSTTP